MKRKRPAAAFMMFVVFLAMGVWYQVSQLPPAYYSCGHRNGFWDSLPGWSQWRWRHRCASSIKMVNDFRNMALGVKIFEAENERLPTNLNELITYGTVPWTSRFLTLMTYETNGSNWSIRVAEPVRHAGYYLVSSSTAVLFHESRPARSGDVVIAGDRYR